MRSAAAVVAAATLHREAQLSRHRPLQRRSAGYLRPKSNTRSTLASRVIDYQVRNTAEAFVVALSPRAPFWQPDPSKWIFRGQSTDKPACLYDCCNRKTLVNGSFRIWSSLLGGSCLSPHFRRRVVSSNHGTVAAFGVAMKRVFVGVLLLATLAGCSWLLEESWSTCSRNCQEQLCRDTQGSDRNNCETQCYARCRH